MSRSKMASCSVMRAAVGVLVVVGVITISLGCAPAPFDSGQVPRLPSMTGMPALDELEKVGPELRRYLVERGRLVLRTPTAAEFQLRPVTVVIRARSDISPTLARHGADVRSVTHDGATIITADVPLPAIPSMLALPELQAIELAQTVDPADANAPAFDGSTGR